MKIYNITTHFIHCRGFSLLKRRAGKKIRAPLLGLPKSIYYTTIGHLKKIPEAHKILVALIQYYFAERKFQRVPNMFMRMPQHPYCMATLLRN